MRFIPGTSERSPDFDIEVMRQLVAVDPLLAYTVVHQPLDSEEHWLKLVFSIEVQPDPGLRARYDALSSHGSS